MKTKGTKNILRNDEINYLDKFWELNKIAKKQNQENKVRTNEQMIDMAKNILDYQLILKDYKYFDFIDKYATAEVVKNGYGKKLYVKLGNGGYISKEKQLGDDISITTITELN